MRTAGRSRWWLGSLVGSDRRGTIAVEFALIVPILLLAFGAVLDLGWLMLAEYKARQIAATVADLAARTEVIDADDAHDMALAGDAIGAPLRMDLDGKVWITYVRTRAADGSTVEWQIHEGGGEARASSAGTGDAGEGDGGDEAGNSPVDWSSRIGSPGSSASIGDLELEAGENLVIAEAILHFRPLVGLVVTEPREIYTRAYARPRYGIVLYQQ
ncbi:MAG: pilus assembly protein [Geminicoccaceae bacterium]|nr:pilus assembly protein [Geminicoccaceae bacterium]